LAEPGGDGGCVNLPGGRGGSRPGAGGEVWQITVPERDGVLFRLPAEMHGAAALMHGFDLPFALLLSAKDGELHVSAPMLAAMRRAGESAFFLDIVNQLAERLPVQVELHAGNKLLVTVR
jgi:hypothetical protein